MPLNRKSKVQLDLEGNLKRKTDQATSSAKDLEEQYKKADSAIEEVSKQDLSKLEKQTKKAGDQAKNTKGSFTILKGAIADFAGNLASDFKNAVGGAVKELFNLGIEANATKTGLISLFDSVSEGAQQYETFVNIAQQFGVASEPIIQVASNLKVANVEGEELEKTIRSLTTAARGNSEAFKSIGLAYNQIISDKVTAENLLQIAEQGVQIWGALADRVGVARNEIRDYVSLGKVSVAEFKLAFDDLAGDESKLRQAAEKTANTIKAKLTNLQTSLSQFAGTFVNVLEKQIAGGLKIATDAVNGLNETIKDIDKLNNFREQIEALNWEINQLNKQIEQTQPNTIQKFLNTVKDIFSAQDQVLVQQAENVEKVAEDLKNMYAAPGHTFENIGEVSSAITSQLDEIDRIREEIRIAEINGETEKVGLLKLQETAAGKLLDIYKLILESRASELDTVDGILEREKIIADLKTGEVSSSERINAIRENIAKVEKEAQVDIDVVNKKRELGLINEKQAQEEINRINEEKLGKLIEIESEIKQLSKDTEEWKQLSKDVNIEQQNIADELNRQKTFTELNLDTYEKRQEFNKKYTEHLDYWVFTLPKVTAELKKQEAIEKARNDLLRERLGMQDGKFITAEDRVKSTGGGSGKNLGDELKDVRTPQWIQDVVKFAESDTFDHIKQGVDAIGTAFQSVGDLIANNVNNELQIMRENLQIMREENQIFRDEIQAQYEEDRDKLQEDHDLALQRITDIKNQKIADAKAEVKNGILTTRQLADVRAKAERDASKQKQEENRRAERAQKKLEKDKEKSIKNLKDQELAAAREIRRQEAIAANQAFHYNKAITLIMATAEGALSVIEALPDVVKASITAGLVAIQVGLILAQQPPPIPSFADGGYVNKPTVAIVGDGGEGEYMIPESKMPKGETYITNNNYKIEGSVLTTEEMIEKIGETLDEGRVF